jgi:hypothetical protein
LKVTSRTILCEPSLLKTRRGARSRPYGSGGGQEPARGRAPLSCRPFNHCASPRACGGLSAL